MKKIFLIMTGIVVLLLACCNNDCPAPIDPDKIYNGVVMREFSDCAPASPNRPPYLVKIYDYSEDTALTMSLPVQHRIPGKELRFKIRIHTSEDGNMICNTLIVPPKLIYLYEITE